MDSKKLEVIHMCSGKQFCLVSSVKLDSRMEHILPIECKINSYYKMAAELTNEAWCV